MLFGELDPDLTDDVYEQPFVRVRIERCKFRESHRRLTARLIRLVRNATRIVSQDSNRGFRFSARLQGFYIFTHFRGRNAPGVGGLEHCLLLVFRHLRPKLLSQQFHMRLHFDSSARHFFFIHAHDLAQAVKLRVHLVEQLTHGVHFNISALVALECEPNRDVLGKFQKRRTV